MVTSNNYLVKRLTDLMEDFRKYARDLGVDLFGVADLTTAKDFIRGQGGEHLAGFNRSLSLGVRLMDDVVDELIHHDSLVAIATYRSMYITVNSTLDRIAFLVAKKIQETGFRAYPVPATQTLNNGRFEAVFSHKLAANLAGLGWIGKNCLLITPDYGPRIRLATILTDAPLDPGAPIKGGCERCHRCINICPVKALTGVAFDPSEPRDIRFQASLCDQYTEGRIPAFGDINCGLCMHICPYGRANVKSNTISSKAINS